MAAVKRLGRGRDDRRGQGGVVAQPVGQGVAIHLARALLVHRQHRRPRGAREIAAHHHLDRQDGDAAADHHIGIGIGQHMVGADIGCAVEPEPRQLRQHLTLERDRGQDAVKGREPVGRDQDAACGVLPVGGQVIAVAHLAEIGVRQFGDAGMVQHAGQVDHRGLRRGWGLFGRGAGDVNRATGSGPARARPRSRLPSPPPPARSSTRSRGVRPARGPSGR
jgi:hypothetical protein